MLYVLDEPTIGLHPRDNRRLLGALQKLRDLGNTLLMVEHDREVVASADQLLDFGPRPAKAADRSWPRHAGASRQSARLGHRAVSCRGKKAIAVPTNPDAMAASRQRSQQKAESEQESRKAAPQSPTELLPPGGGWLEIVGARHNNLRNVDVRIPLGTLTVVTGVSGSGKSSLIEDVLYNSLARTLHRASTFPAAHDAIAASNRSTR